MGTLGAIAADNLEVLLTWFDVLRACAIVLAVASLAFGLLSLAREPRGALCAVAVVALASAIGAGALAWGAWTTHSDLLPANLPPSFPEAFLSMCG